MKDPVYCLLIDDDEEDKELFEQALKNVNPKVLLHYSPSGADAIENLVSGNFKPDYIFLGLNMMPMSGMTCLVEIKRIRSCADIPVIIYSTTINEDLKYKSLKLGAFDHFEKPSLQSGLEAYLKRVMQIK